MPPSLYGPNLRNRKIPTETILLSRFHRPKDQLEPRPLYPQKRTFQGDGHYVRFVPKAGILADAESGPVSISSSGATSRVRHYPSASAVLVPLLKERAPVGFPTGAYKANSSVRLVSPPVELPDQRGGDRLDERRHAFGKICLPTRSRKDGQVGAVEARISVFGAPEETRRQLPTKESRQPDLVAAAKEPTVIGIRANRGNRRVQKDIAKVDPIKAGFSVAAIPVSEDIRSDQIANPSADSPGILLFLFAGDAVKSQVGNTEILVQVHEVVIGERADDPIAPEPAPAELIVAAAAHPAEPTATARCGFGCALLPVG